MGQANRRGRSAPKSSESGTLEPTAGRAVACRPQRARDQPSRCLPLATQSTRRRPGFGELRVPAVDARRFLLLRRDRCGSGDRIWLTSQLRREGLRSIGIEPLQLLRSHPESVRGFWWCSTTSQRWSSSVSLNSCRVSSGSTSRLLSGSSVWSCSPIRSGSFPRAARRARECAGDGCAWTPDRALDAASVVGRCAKRVGQRTSETDHWRRNLQRARERR